MQPVFQKCKNGYRRLFCHEYQQVLYSSRENNLTGVRWQQAGMIEAWREHAKEAHGQAITKEEASIAIFWTKKE